MDDPYGIDIYCARHKISRRRLGELLGGVGAGTMRNWGTGHRKPPPFLRLALLYLESHALLTPGERKVRSPRSRLVRLPELPDDKKWGP